jgi:hypothetical protein
MVEQDHLRVNLGSCVVSLETDLETAPIWQWFHDANAAAIDWCDSNCPGVKWYRTTTMHRYAYPSKFGFSEHEDCIRISWCAEFPSLEDKAMFLMTHDMEQYKRMYPA